MDSPLTTEDRLVLLCARVELEPWHAEELARLIHGSVDWDQVLVRVTRHGISTLLHRHLREHRIPASVAGALEASTRAARLQVLRQRAEALRLLDALAGANVEAIPLKGLALRERYYPDPALRPSGDLDLLLRPGDAVRAEAILQGLGYRPNESELPASWYQLNRFHHVVPYRLPGRDVQIELHAGLFEPAAGITVDLDGLWLRSCGGEIAGRPVRWLSPEDLLLHLTVHACASSRFQTGLRHLVDLGEVVRRHCS